MDKSIKDILKAVDLIGVIEKSPKVSLNSFVSDAVNFYQKGKLGKINNGPQLPYFAIHLACLKYHHLALDHFYIIACFFRNSVVLDAVYLQKKSGLNAKIYQNTLIALHSVQTGLIVSARSLANYYSCPSLEGLIDDLLERSGGAKDGQNISLLIIAAGFQISLSAKLKIGTLAQMAQLWAQNVDDLKDACARLKPFVNLPKDINRILTNEINSNISNQQQQQGQELDQLQDEDLKIVKKNKTKSSSNEMIVDYTHHPLMNFNCSRTAGPAFGPIIF
jgi:hypothetical protein